MQFSGIEMLIKSNVMFKGDSTWSLFQQSKCSLPHNVESNCDEVSSVKKVAKNVRGSVLDSISIKVRKSSYKMLHGVCVEQLYKTRQNFVQCKN